MNFKLIVSFALLLSSIPAFSMVAKIYEIAEGKNTEDHLVLMESGHVIFVSQLDKSKLQEYKDKLKLGEEIEFEAREPEKLGQRMINVSVPNNILSAFDQMNPNWKSDGQCHDKAHVWAYEASKKKIEMKKLFMFFTKDYIRKYSFPWWFHVSPIMYDKSDVYVMDKVFLDIPSPVREWTDYFVESGNACGKIKYYSTYAENKWNKDCYIIETNKYTRQPSHIRTNANRTGFIIQEVNNAYKRAFYSQDEL